MKQIFIDSSFFYALIIETDKFHSEALSIYDQFRRDQTDVVVTNFVLDETYTLLRARKGLPKALKLRDTIESSEMHLTLIRVTKEDEDRVWDWFTRDWSDLSYTDCTSFAVMKRLGLTDVATFDAHFAKAGFTIL